MMVMHNALSKGQLDIEQPAALIDYLQAEQRILPGERLEIRVLYGGVSNRTVWVRRTSGETWVLKQALEKLRVSTEWFSSPTRIAREALALRSLQAVAPLGTVPLLVFEDHEASLLAMQAIPEPHDNWKQLLLSGQIVRDHVIQFASWLAQVHRRASEMKTQLALLFDDRSFFESLRIAPYYAYTANRVPEASDFLNDLIHTTRRTRLTLVHGDYSPKNVLIYNQRLIVLDYEVIHFGDPAFDLGFSLTHLLSKAHHLEARCADFADSAHMYWNVYRETLGSLEWTATLESRAVRHTLACLMARVAGKSPLEYLSETARQRQKQIVLTLMPNPPDSIPSLIDRFISAL